MKIKDIYENIIVMLYIIILTIATAVIILYSKDIYSKVSIYTDEFEDLEVAMSYINVKVRQNDRAGVISVKTQEGLDEKALVFTENGVCTWIFEYDNKLVEKKADVGTEPVLIDYIVIAEIDDFQVSLQDKLLKYEITVKDGLTETSTINIRSDN